MQRPSFPIAFLASASSVLRASAVVGALLLACFAPASAQAQEQHRHEEDHSHDHTLHFTHPVIAESVSPDTKLRLSYGWQDLGQESESELELEGEYAFHRAFSIEAGVHYHPESRELGATHVILKFANYAFEEEGLLLGYGIEFGLPTGPGGHAHGAHGHGEDEHEHEHEEPEDDIYEVMPFLNAGLQAGRWELVGWTLFSIPTNQNFQERVGTELRYSASVLYHASSRIEALVEAHGQSGLSGLETGRAVVNFAPGLRISPLPERNLALGAALSFPVTRDQSFDARLLVSAFYHF